jgi:hypothetical protein
VIPRLLFEGDHSKSPLAARLPLAARPLSYGMILDRSNALPLPTPMQTDPAAIADEIRLDQAAGELLLILRVAENWNDAALHTLQERINHCLVYLQSGQVFTAWPSATACELVIEIDSAHAPTAQALAFLEQATAIISDAGLVLRYQASPRDRAGLLPDQ